MHAFILSNMCLHSPGGPIFPLGPIGPSPPWGPKGPAGPGGPWGPTRPSLPPHLFLAHHRRWTASQSHCLHQIVTCCKLVATTCRLSPLERLFIFYCASLLTWSVTHMHAQCVLLQTVLLIPSSYWFSNSPYWFSAQLASLPCVPMGQGTEWGWHGAALLVLPHPTSGHHLG